MRVITPLRLPDVATDPETENFGLASLSPSMLVSSTARTGLHAPNEWGLTGDSYSVGDERWVGAPYHRWYRCRAAHALDTSGKVPMVARPGEPTSWWEDIGPVNQWAMFDLLRTGPTRGYGFGSISSTVTRFFIDRSSTPGPEARALVTIAPGQRADALAVLGMRGAQDMRVTVERPTVGVVYDTDWISMVDRHSTGYYDYCFGDLTRRDRYALFDLPPYLDAQITIEWRPGLYAATPIIDIGTVWLGRAHDIGDAVMGAENDAQNYSRIERQIDGVLQVTKRRNVPTNRLDLLLDQEQIPRVLALRDSLPATPAVYVGSGDTDSGFYATFFRYGIYRRWKVAATNSRRARASLEIEEI